MAAETVLVVFLLIYDRWEGLGETGRVEVLIAESLRYVFWFVVSVSFYWRVLLPCFGLSSHTSAC